MSASKTLERGFTFEAYALQGAQSGVDSTDKAREPQGNAASESIGGKEQGGYPEGAPSLLSSKYLAVQGGTSIVLGATKRLGLTPEEAFQVLIPPYP